jgi:class 3 adenylate cyclase
VFASRAARLLGRLALIGQRATDTDDIRAQKATLVLGSTTIVVLATAWVAIYGALGLYASAAVPFAYQVTTFASLLAFARNGQLPWFRASQLSIMLVLPFVLQWSLGGYASSSAVSLWATISVFGALFFYPAAAAIPWLLAFLGLTLLSGFVDPLISPRAPPIPYPVAVAFFVLTISGVTLTAYVMLQYSVRAREAAHGRSESLLLNVLPGPIAERLKRERRVVPERAEDVTVLFADVVDFTRFAESTSPERVVGVLDDLFTTFDELTAHRGLEKIKTIGDAYMVVGGVPDRRPDHAEAVVELGLEMLTALDGVRHRTRVPLDLRVGIHSGPVVAGVIGRQRFQYDLWGDTVNTAARMESHGVPGRIQVTEEVARRLADRYVFDHLGQIDIKGKGPISTCLLVSRRDPPDSAP